MAGVRIERVGGLMNWHGPRREGGFTVLRRTVRVVLLDGRQIRGVRVAFYRSCGRWFGWNIAFHWGDGA